MKNKNDTKRRKLLLAEEFVCWLEKLLGAFGVKPYLRGSLLYDPGGSINDIDVGLCINKKESWNGIKQCLAGCYTVLIDQRDFVAYRGFYKNMKVDIAMIGGVFISRELVIRNAMLNNSGVLSLYKSFKKQKYKSDVEYYDQKDIFFDTIYGKGVWLVVKDYFEWCFLYRIKNLLEKWRNKKDI